jgi:hypothetical protein
MKANIKKEKDTKSGMTRDKALARLFPELATFNCCALVFVTAIATTRWHRFD